jgi:hypothetical protein
MHDDPLFGETRPSLMTRLTRVLARQSLLGQTRSVRRERLDLLVPPEKADAIKAAVERWLAGRGVTAAVTLDAVGEKSRIRANLDSSEASKLDFSDDAIQTELEELIENAIS